MTTRPAVRARHRARRQAAEAELLESMARLLETVPYAAISVDDVTASTTVSRTGFYRYFPDVRSVLLRLVADVVRELAEASAPWLDGRPARSPRAALKASLEAVCEVFRRHGPLFRALADAAAADPEVARQYHGAIEGFAQAVQLRIEAEQHAGRARSFDARGVARALVALNERHLAWSFSAVAPSDDPSREIVEIWTATIYGRRTPTRTASAPRARPARR